VSINQLTTSSETLYSSLESPLPPSLVSQGYEATGTSQLGEQVTLASANQPLSNVVVTMESWTCKNCAAVAASPTTLCSTTPGATFNEPITFNNYNVGSDGTSVGALITSDTQTFAIPYRPSATPATCPESAIENGGGYRGSVSVTTASLTTSRSTVSAPQSICPPMSFTGLPTAQVQTPMVATMVATDQSDRRTH
jgi:D-arabinose 1-dehydrogenase-like Zn-dependent alcohol dehydrogenase